MATPSLPPARIFGNADAATRRRQTRVLGARPAGFRDVYHLLLRLTWWQFFALMSASFLSLNTLFGSLYWLTQGIANARADSFADHFFFSVHTLGTIGYGSMYPQTFPAEVVMTAEAMAGLFVSAVVTGLAFARFARPTSRVLWSKVAVVSDRDSVPTLMFRVANERMNHVVEANIRVAMLRREVTQEGESVRRIVDLPLMRSNSPSFIMSWTVMHPVTPSSPLYGMTVEKLAQNEVEIVLNLTGLDETLMQTIHARTSYLPSEIVFGARFEDVLSGVDAQGHRLVDYRKFHDTKPAPLSWEKLGASTG